MNRDKCLYVTTSGQSFGDGSFSLNFLRGYKLMNPSSIVYSIMEVESIWCFGDVAKHEGLIDKFISFDTSALSWMKGRRPFPPYQLTEDDLKSYLDNLIDSRLNKLSFDTVIFGNNLAKLSDYFLSEEMNIQNSVKKIVLAPLYHGFSLGGIKILKDSKTELIMPNDLCVNNFGVTDRGCSNQWIANKMEDTLIPFLSKLDKNKKTIALYPGSSNPLNHLRYTALEKISNKLTDTYNIILLGSYHSFDDSSIVSDRSEMLEKLNLIDATGLDYIKLTKLAEYADVSIVTSGSVINPSHYPKKTIILETHHNAVGGYSQSINAETVAVRPLCIRFPCWNYYENNPKSNQICIENKNDDPRRTSNCANYDINIEGIWDALCFLFKTEDTPHKFKYIGVEFGHEKEYDRIRWIQQMTNSLPLSMHGWPTEEHQYPNNIKYLEKTFSHDINYSEMHKAVEENERKADL